MAKQVLTNLDLNKLPIQNFVIEDISTADNLFTTTLPPASNKNRLIFVTHSNNEYDTSGAIGLFYCDGIKWYKVPTSKEITDAMNSAISTANPITNVSISGHSMTFTFKDGTTKNANLSYSPASQSADGLMSAADKKKIDNIEAGANKTVVDIALSSSSTNPVQNKVISVELNKKVPNTRTVNGHALSSDITISKSDVGLGNVLNVAQIPASEKGTANGVATLDSAGKVPAAQLPSYVDDVIELSGVVSGTTYSELTVGKMYYNTTSKKIITATSATAGTSSDPETGKIYSYVGTTGSGFTQNMIYRWGGTTMTEISSSPDVQGSNVTLAAGDITSDSTTPTATTKTVKGWIGKLASNIKYVLDNFVPKTRKVIAGTGISGGGDLSGNVTISHQAKPTSGGTDAGGTGTVVTGVTIDSLGHVISTSKTTLPSYTSVKTYTSGALTGTSGTISKATHGINTIGSVEAYMGNNKVICDITLNSDGGVTWATGVTMASGSNFIIKIVGK